MAAALAACVLTAAAVACTPTPPASGPSKAPTTPDCAQTAPSSTTTTVPGGGTARWQPTSDQPLALQWVLASPLKLTSPTQMGLVDFSGGALPTPDVYDIDGECNTAATVAALHAQGSKAICYIDAGVYETYRNDAASFPKSVIGSADHGWTDSFWLDIRKISTLAPIMKARIADCGAKGFDAVEPDEVDGYANASGFSLTAADQLAYNQAVAGWVHDAGMSVLLKGDVEQAVALQPYFDFTLNEECDIYGNCSPGLDAFSSAGKAVFIAEYPDDTPIAYPVNTTGPACQNGAAKHWNLSWYRLGLPNNGGRQPCAVSW
jgi:hypothetical protein